MLYLQDLLLQLLISDYMNTLDNFTANQLLDNMLNRLIITEDEYTTMKIVLSDKALKSPFNVENVVRANIFKQFVLSLLKGDR